MSSNWQQNKIQLTGHSVTPNKQVVIQTLSIPPRGEMAVWCCSVLWVSAGWTMVSAALGRPCLRFPPIIHLGSPHPPPPIPQPPIPHPHRLGSLCQLLAPPTSSHQLMGNPNQPFFLPILSRQIQKLHFLNKWKWKSYYLNDLNIFW